MFPTLRPFWFRKEKVSEQGIKSNKSCTSLTLFANLDMENFSNAGTVNHNNSFKMKSTSHALEKLRLNISF